jgi:hypothetical protein
MTKETERPTFRGVVCLHCKAPIPVPPIVGSLQSAGSEGTESSQRKSQVFNIRCPQCHKEKPYRTREIVDFAGTIEMAMTPEPRAPRGWYSQDELTRAAKA